MPEPIASTFCILPYQTYLLLFVRVAEFAAGGDVAVFEAGAGEAVVDVGVDVDVDPVTPLNDLIYATSETSCSSVTCPLKVGMIG
jgi:hypothetical protein